VSTLVEAPPLVVGPQRPDVVGTLAALTGLSREAVMAKLDEAGAA
jgi:hypothetical protein